MTCIFSIILGTIKYYGQLIKLRSSGQRFQHEGSRSPMKICTKLFILYTTLLIELILKTRPRRCMTRVIGV